MKKSNSNLLRKPDVAVAIAPRVGRLTASGRKMFNSMLYHAQEQLTQLRREGRVQESRDSYRAELRAVMVSVGENPRTRMTQMKKYINEMQDIKVRWCSPQQGAKVLYASMVLVASARLSVEHGVLWLDWSFPAEINGLLWDLDRFTLIRLEELSQMTTYTAVTLYEICAKYADNPSHKTCVNHPEWWVEVLSNDLGRTNPYDENEPPNLRQWKSFKKERVLEAIEEINTKTGLRIEMIEQRSGGRITSVQFDVRRIKQAETDSIEPPITKDMASIIAKGISLGYGEMPMRTLIRNGYSLEEITINLSKMEARRAREDLPPLEREFSYFRSLFKNDREETANITPTPIAPRPIDKIIQVPLFTDLGDIAGNDQTADRIPVEDPTAEFKAKFSSLDESERTFHLKKLESSLRARGVLTAHIERSVASGNWQSKSILFELKRMLEATDALVEERAVA